MITTLIGIQTVCIITASGYVIKRLRPKPLKFKRVLYDSKEFKHYKTF